MQDVVTELPEVGSNSRVLSWSKCNLSILVGNTNTTLEGHLTCRGQDIILTLGTLYLDPSGWSEGGGSGNEWSNDNSCLIKPIER